MDNGQDDAGNDSGASAMGAGDQDVLFGLAGDDEIQLGADNIANGGAGRDRFIVDKQGSPETVIEDFQPGVDRLQIAWSSGFTDVYVSEHGLHAIDAVNLTTMMTVSGMTLMDGNAFEVGFLDGIGDVDETIVFEDPCDQRSFAWDAIRKSDVDDDLSGTDGDDAIFGEDGADILKGGGAADRFHAFANVYEDQGATALPTDFAPDEDVLVVEIPVYPTTASAEGFGLGDVLSGLTVACDGAKNTTLIAMDGVAIATLTGDRSEIDIAVHDDYSTSEDRWRDSDGHVNSAETGMNASTILTAVECYATVGSQSGQDASGLPDSGAARRHRAAIVRPSHAWHGPL